LSIMKRVNVASRNSVGCQAAVHCITGWWNRWTSSREIQNPHHANCFTRSAAPCFLWISTPNANRIGIMHDLGRVACTIAWAFPDCFLWLRTSGPVNNWRSGGIILSPPNHSCSQSG
jgi:hypothetical protein